MLWPLLEELFAAFLKSSLKTLKQLKINTIDILVHIPRQN